MIYKIIRVSLLISTLTGCLYYPPVNTNYNYNNCQKKMTTHDAPNGWQSNERLYDIKHVGDYCRLFPSLYADEKYRKGISPKGIEYKIYSSGAASLGQWSISCKTDTMTDERNCSIFSTETDNKLFIYMKKSKVSDICIMSHDFPYRTGAIRIDKNKPIKTNYGGCINGNYINKFYSAQNVSLRYYKWPDDYPRDRTHSIDGLKEAVNLAQFIYKNIDKISF